MSRSSAAIHHLPRTLTGAINKLRQTALADPAIEINIEKWINDKLLPDCAVVLAYIWASPENEELAWNDCTGKRIIDRFVRSQYKTKASLEYRRIPTNRVGVALDLIMDEEFGAFNCMNFSAVEEIEMFIEKYKTDPKKGAVEAMCDAWEIIKSDREKAEQERQEAERARLAAEDEARRQAEVDTAFKIYVGEQAMAGVPAGTPEAVEMLRQQYIAKQQQARAAALHAAALERVRALITRPIAKAGDPVDFSKLVGKLLAVNVNEAGEIWICETRDP